ncbi:chromosome segregation protein SMC [Clostridium sporogenes]|uniref:Chromosome partition protein Smc n=1 Tax=Clostridium sporogenes TaxID=1509 RepID=A0A1L3NJX8_CLOSG|nr:chromosome segregation protein SMC [Clostridium sporogenes]APH16466.1 chromosome segregation protein SMC [Clostridium sporogenes]
MFLKSIEIRGFKSFADKTELIFKQGVTAIVGPNGSGKSNISDAVKWVLGEQSVKSLRGSKMEDVIFAGTQYRKPVGLCQVSLILDNSDKDLPIEYTEVTITRRLYRSGESEYYINNTQCRLKDIQELFMDTGIGKEGYSIIGQGKIEAVLSGKPEERRSLLEEAAGIVKFKWRKEEADKKLSNTEQNLIRIKDILNTYEERIEPLKEESEKAKKFLNLSEELKHKEVNIMIYSIDKIEKDLENINNNMLSLSENIDNLKNEKSQYKEIILKFNEKLELLDKNNGKNKEEYYYNKDKNKDIENENILLKEKIKNLKDNIKVKENTLKTNEERLQNYLKEKEDLEKKLNKLKEEEIYLREEIDKKEDNINNFNKELKEKEDKLKMLKSEEIEILSNTANLTNEISVMENEIVNLKNKLDNIKNSCDSYISSININIKTKEDIEKEIKNIKENILSLENNLKENSKNIGSLKISLNNKEKKLKEKNAAYSRLEANYHMLSNLEKHYEGYNRSVKTLMEHVGQGKIDNINGGCEVLGDIIKVKKEFETAMEIALGGAISNVITEDENKAKILINYLKKRSLGRATFLPLTTIQGRKAKINNVTREDGFLGIASDLIDYDVKFSNIIDYVLGRTLVANDMDSALKIAKKLNYSFKIVTLEGEVINPGGSLTGGSIKHRAGSSIISRKREIEETRKELEETKNTIEEFMSNILENKNKIKTLDEENLNIKDEVYYNNIEITKFTGKLNAIKEDTERLRSSLNISREEIKLTKDKIKEVEENINSSQKQLEELKLRKDSNHNAIKECEDFLQNEEENVKNIKDKLIEYKIEKAKLDEMLVSIKKEFYSMDTNITNLNNENKNINKGNHEDRTNIEKFQNNIKENEDNIKDIKTYLENLEEKFKKYEVERIKLKEELEKNKNKEENLVLILSKKEDEVHKQDIQKTRYITERENLYNKLNEEFSLTYAEALSYKKEDINVIKYKEYVQNLKIEISNLGTVNVGSIEEYKELNEKITFMSNQKEDLVKSKEELLNVIEEMTNKMRTVFSENFNKLRKNFNETFIELFKGGSADLILSNGDELTANIEINVQPPGKKLQNINLMSGGEKGLSAIALLFAILKMKPTPFCILDEIEAALDDANVTRYADFLKEFSENSQFIVITHRKGTMEACDALYGVTMEEKGVSKIISVDLTSKDEVAATL